MKKLMTVAALVASALIFTGCGGKPQIPENTVAAVYVDIENLVGNAIDVIDDAIDEIPNKDQRKEAREEFKKFIKERKPDLKAIDAEWLVITMGVDKGAGPEFAAVLKCDCKTPIPSAGNQSVKDLFKGGKKIASEAKYETVQIPPEIFDAMIPTEVRGMLSPSLFVTIAKDKYVIFTMTKDMTDKMVDLYVNGKGKTSDDFDDLTDIGGDTIIRVQTAEVETVAKNLGFKEEIEKFFKEAGDEDMADLILDIENLTLDINFSDDIIGGVLTVDAGSRELAKVVESAFNVAAFASRFAVDMVAGEPEKYRTQFGLGRVSKEAFAKMVKAVAEEARDAVESDRSGSTATLTVELDTGDLLEAIVPALSE